MNFMGNTDRSKKLIRLSFIAFALAMAIFHDAVTFNQAKGLGFLVFITCLILGFLVLSNIAGSLKNRWPLLLLVPIFVLGFDVFLYNNFLVKFFVPFVIYVLVIFFAILVTLRLNNKIFYFENIPLVKNVFLPIKNWVQIARDIFGSKESSRGPLYKKIAFGLIAAVPVLFVFTVLFSAADAVFADRLFHLFDVKLYLDPETVARTVKTLFLAMVFAGFLYVLEGDSHALKDGIRLPARFDATVVSIVFGLVNVLFLTFIFIQIKYLFGAAPSFISANLTYADYARQGFFELVAVMVLAGLLILSMYRSFNHHGMAKVLLFLKLLLIAQVMVVAASALKRMNLYQDAYGFTTLRLYVEWFIYAAMAGFITLAVALAAHWQFRKFFYSLAVAALVIFTVVASVNADAMIAQKNIQQALAKDRPLDINYLINLSVDAAPDVLRAIDSNVRLDYPNRKDAKKVLANLIAYQTSMRGASWRQFNIGMNNASQLLGVLLKTNLK